MSTEDIAPKHDPLAEEMDLITFQEADARLFKELAHTRSLVEQLKSADPVDHEEIAAQQVRLDAWRGSRRGCVANARNRRST